MYSTIFVGFVFLFIECITGVQCDDRVIIGSSVGGFVGLVIVILDIIAIFELLTSGGRGICAKLIWILIIIFFPILGLLLYFFCARNRTVDQVL